MKIVEDTLEQPLSTVLDKPLFCYLAMVSTDGYPRLSPLWFLWEDQRIWIIADPDKTYTTRIIEEPQTAVAVVDFDPNDGRVCHIGMRGRSELVPYDEDRAKRLLTKYLGPDQSAWDDMFVDIDPESWRLIAFDPNTVVARDQSYGPSL